MPSPPPSPGTRSAHSRTSLPGHSPPRRGSDAIAAPGRSQVRSVGPRSLSPPQRRSSDAPARLRDAPGTGPRASPRQVYGTPPRSPLPRALQTASPASLHTSPIRGSPRAVGSSGAPQVRSRELFLDPVATGAESPPASTASAARKNIVLGSPSAGAAVGAAVVCLRSRLELGVDEYFRTRRAAMEDAGQGIFQQAQEWVFDNAAADQLEAMLDTGASSALHGIFQRSHRKVDWGQWKAVGETMLTPDGEELAVSFGENMRRLYFNVGRCFLDSASYGAAPRPVLAGRVQTEKAFQRNPVQWRFTALPPRWSIAKAQLAEFIGTDDDYIQILSNTNAAINAVLKSLPWRLGDRVLIFSTDDDATALACDWLRREHGVETFVLRLEPPMTDAEVVTALEKMLAYMKVHGGLPVFVSFCHVSPKAAWVMPAKALVAACHKHAVSVLIDGSLSVGQLDFTTRDINADWYVGGTHAWCYSCAGAAFLVTKPWKHDTTFPQTVSYFDGKGYDTEFSYYGLQDWSAWLSVVDGLDFVYNVCGGWSKVRQYSQWQADNIAGWCVSIWRSAGLRGPRWLQEWPKPLQGEGRYGQMPIIPLPWSSEADATVEEAERVTAALMLEDVTARVLVVPVRSPVDGRVHDTLGIRCACQIFTCKDDWTHMAKKVADLRAKYHLADLPEAVKAFLPFAAGSEIGGSSRPLGW
eukprot:Hpha_TRINITY_DN9655_c0_g1::TRINITY_DN9655_c0_g1_i1::g.184561::m.184561